jgi:hypothetical protein
LAIGFLRGCCVVRERSYVCCNLRCWVGRFVLRYWGMKIRPSGEGNGAHHSRAVNPGYIVSVQDSSPETLQSIIAHLEASTDFEHLIYREAELDAIWTITGFFLMNEPRSSELDTVKRLHAGVHRAHDLVAESQPVAAAVVLRAFL